LTLLLAVGGVLRQGRGAKGRGEAELSGAKRGAT